MKGSRIGPIWALVAMMGALALSACATVTSPRAASDVRALALALQARDAAAIEARIDRPALRNQIIGLARAWLLEEAQSGRGLRQWAAGAAYASAEAANPLVERAVDAMLSPRILADIGRISGLTPDRQVPGQAVTAIVLRPAGDNRVCLPDPRQATRCMLYFTDGATGWRLSAIDETALRARLPEAFR